MYELELTNACYKLLHDMFDLQPGESLAITCDTESNMDVVNATAKAAFALGAKPLVLKMSTPREDNKPNLFVFSQRKYKNKELHREIMRIKNLLNSLLFLKGLYSMDELSLLYLLTNAPREQKVLLYSADQLKIKYSDEVIIFLNTLRLYLVLRSIKEVSQLLGIHVNSVKYRIEKAVQYMEMGSDLSLNEISSLGTLLYLERMTAERR